MEIVINVSSAYLFLIIIHNFFFLYSFMFVLQRSTNNLLGEIAAFLRLVFIWG